MTTQQYRPTERFFASLAGLSVASLLCFVWPPLTLPLLIGLGLLGLSALSDLIHLFQVGMAVSKPKWNRQPTILQPFRLTFQLRPHFSSLITFHVRAIESDAIQLTQPNAHIQSNAQGLVWASWDCRSAERGDIFWPGINIRFRTPLGLVEKWQRSPATSIPIYPKLTIDLTNQLNPQLLIQQLGVKSNRKLRADQEFESLRPYIQGDNYRHIDWKATARMQQLITRQFKVEHHHNILICLDTSRLMGTLTKGISKLDWAIQASLHLAYLAARFEDKMGMVIFSNTIENWIKPVSQPLQHTLRHVYNVQSKIVEADFYNVCHSVLSQQKKRSLVIFLSDFMDASSLEPALNAFSHLNQKHCSIFVSIEDPVYKSLLDKHYCDTAEEATQKLVAHDLMRRREGVLEQLRQMGIRALTVSPENLIQRTIETYMQVKLQGAI